ncbi:MAG TPA: AAA family ATPase [Pyrinomonadaceae bacterium]|nr:AAA family ATPase [Pyrinomonadaceae bacterium]
MAHLLSQITIRNFRSIKDHTFDLSSFTPLVGYNNAGKSNILTAIEWLLRTFALDEGFFNDATQEVEVIGKIEGITAELLELLAEPHRNSIMPYLSNDSLTIRRTLASPGTARNIKLSVQDPNQIGTDTEWRPNPTGIDNAITALFPEPILIGAMQDAGEDVSKFKNTTTIGKLLAEIIAPVQENHEQTISDALADVRALLDSDGENRAQELIDFDNEASEKIGAFFPGIRLKVHIPTPELKDVFSRGTIKILEGDMANGKDIGTYGHGTQRSIQMALIRYLADKKRGVGPNASTTLLLIDEPELYLHPQAIEILRDALKRLSSEGYQVIFSTHSPCMITSEDILNTILVRKVAATGTYCRNTLRAAIPTLVEDAPSQVELIFSLTHSSEVLFSERVILAEGTTEKRVFPRIVEKITGQSLGMQKIALVVLNGSQNIKKASEILRAMDLPTKVVADLDYVLRHGEADGCVAAGDTDIAAIMAHLAGIATGNGINLENGFPTKKNSSMTAAEAFQFLAAETAIQQNIADLHNKLNAVGVWIWKKGDLEAHLGCIDKNEAAWAAFCGRLPNENLSDMLPDDHQELTDCVNWLLAE